MCSQNEKWPLARSSPAPAAGAGVVARGRRVRLPLVPTQQSPTIPIPRALVALRWSLPPLVPLFVAHPRPRPTPTVFRRPFHFAAAGALSLPPTTPDKNGVGERPEDGPSLPLNSLSPLSVGYGGAGHGMFQGMPKRLLGGIPPISRKPSPPHPGTPPTPTCGKRGNTQKAPGRSPGALRSSSFLRLRAGQKSKPPKSPPPKSPPPKSPPPKSSPAPTSPAPMPMPIIDPIMEPIIMPVNMPIIMFMPK